MLSGINYFALIGTWGRYLFQELVSIANKKWCKYMPTASLPNNCSSDSQRKVVA